MSHNIDKAINPKPPCPPQKSIKVACNAVIEGDKSYHCQKEKDKDKVAVLTRQYNELIAEAKAARDAANTEHDCWQAKAAALEGLALEANATANKAEILAKIAEVKAAVANVETYAVLSDDDWDEVFAATEAE